jgi:hypothetical protein
MRPMKQITLLLLIFSSFLTHAQMVPYQDQEHIQAIENFREQCLEIKKYTVGKMAVDCHYNYHHFNATAVKNYNQAKALQHGQVKIAGFNVLHPGMSKTRYKDYDLMAKMINNWDVIAATELLPLVSDDLKNNQMVVRFMQNANSEIKKLENRLSKTKNEILIAELKLQIESIKNDLKNVPNLYRAPGYLEILQALHKLPGGKDWALILSPRGEAQKASDVQEMVGFYYRSSIVKPEVNAYCKEVKTANYGNPYACIPNFGLPLFEKNKRNVFSRRPFLADFKSGNFTFSLLASHIIYNSPTEAKLMKEILNLSFGVDDYTELGIGADKGNYARWVETKVTLELMEKIRNRYPKKKLIYVGDMNLEANNRMWETVLPTFRGAEIFVTEPTSVSEGLISKSGPTNGLANNYDHFIFDPNDIKECDTRSAKAFNFYEGRYGNQVRKKYLVRNEDPRTGKITKDVARYKEVEEEVLGPILKGKVKFETVGTKIINHAGKALRVLGIIEDTDKKQKFISGFRERVLKSQLSDKSYYTFYKQVLSDHLPISINCFNK